MDTSDDAQRTLERKALRNVRTLVDKVEAEDREGSKGAVVFALKFLPVIVVAGIVIVAGLQGYSMWRARQAPPPPASASEYVDQMFAKIEKRVTRGTRRDIENLDGRVEVAFDVKANGYVDNLRVVQSSNNSVVDGESAGLVKGSEPYGRLPAGAAAPLAVKATVLFGSHAGGRGSFKITPRKEAP